MHDMNLPELGPSSIERLDAPESVVRRAQQALPSATEVYVLWEPYVTQLTQSGEMHRIIDSSAFSGYIVDTLVVSRELLAKDEPLVQSVLESYFIALNRYPTESALANQASPMAKLLIEDAKGSGAFLTEAQSNTLAKGISWRNTLDNFAHFGVQRGKVTHIEDVIQRLTRVLIASGSIDADPTAGEPTQLFNGKPIAELQTKNFYPGLVSERATATVELRSLTDSEWQSAQEVGTLKMPELVFGRGSDVLTERSQQILNELAETLNVWPRYYLLIKGGALVARRSRGKSNPGCPSSACCLRISTILGTA